MNKKIYFFLLETLDLIHSKKNIDGSFVYNQNIGTKKIYEKILQKAFLQNENNEIKSEKEEENEIKQADSNCEENDEYLNLLLMKEGKPAESLVRRGSIKKKVENISNSISSCNLAPEVLKQSNKLNMKNTPFDLAKYGRVYNSFT